MAASAALALHDLALLAAARATRAAPTDADGRPGGDALALGGPLGASIGAAALVAVALRIGPAGVLVAAAVALLARNTPPALASRLLSDALQTTALLCLLMAFAST